MTAYRQLQPVASHRGDGADEASQCNQQPGISMSTPELRGETTQEGHGSDQGGSGHDIQREQPELVLHAIRDVVLAVRAGDLVPHRQAVRLGLS